MPIQRMPRKNNKAKEMSRRQFLKEAGLFVGGAAIGVSAGAGAWLPREEVATPVMIEVPIYVCPYCISEFDCFNALSTHITTEHAGMEIISQFVCPHCGQIFSSLEALKVHLGNEGIITLSVNGDIYELKIKSDWSLAFVLREKLGLTGTKIGCDRGSCGTCTVIIDGRPVYSCMILAIAADGRDIVTIEGISDMQALHPIQQAFIDNDASQCGFCTPGFIMSAKALLDSNPNPTRDEVREALSGHICVCGHTKKIVDAVLYCARKE